MLLALLSLASQAIAAPSFPIAIEGELCLDLSAPPCADPGLSVPFALVLESDGTGDLTAYGPPTLITWSYSGGELVIEADEHTTIWATRTSRRCVEGMWESDIAFVAVPWAGCF
jgi:hypothetical protein